MLGFSSFTTTVELAAPLQYWPSQRGWIAELATISF